MGAVRRGTGELVPDETVQACLRAAMAAPSVHNTQPWAFRMRRGELEVLVDHRRHLPTLDPDGRELYVSVGAAVYTLWLALRAHGWDAEVELVPGGLEALGGGAAQVAARVVVLRAAPVPASVHRLAAAIPRRHTNRRPFAEHKPPADLLDELARAAAGEGGQLLVADTPLRQAVLSLTRTAERRQRENPDYLPELRRWTTAGAPARRDGVPRQALGPRSTDGALPLRDFGIGHGLPASIVDFEADPTIALLLTDGDTPAHWLRAGMALQAVLLTATVRGLAATPLSQLTEVAALRDLLSDTAGAPVVQTVLRLGYALHPAVATPRRDLTEVLLD